MTLKAQIEAEKSDAKLRGLGYGHGASRLEARGHTDGSGGGREAELVGGQRARTEAELRAGTGSAYTQVETHSSDRSDTFKSQFSCTGPTPGKRAAFGRAGAIKIGV